MEHTITGLAERPVDAQLVIGDLVDGCLCDRSDISLMAGERAGQPSAPAQAASVAAQLAAVAGAAAASALGGIVGAASAVSRPVSGLGVVSAAGELGARLAKTALGASADLAKVLAEFGVDDRRAREYSEALRSGKILIIVHAKSEKMQLCARKVMAARGVLAEANHAH